jgi:hypothetical protein
MWILALFLILVVISILVTYWPLTLAGLALWAFVARTRHVAADAMPSYALRPVRTRPVAPPAQYRPEPTSVQTRPGPKAKPDRDIPAPDYLPRWTANRRLDAGREHAQWQHKFDNAAQ